MTPYEKFRRECAKEICSQGGSAQLSKATFDWMNKANTYKYTYHFEWLGRPIIQYPQDIVAIQELIWRVKPDLIIETGIAHGGSLILSASMLALIDICELGQATAMPDPSKPRRVVAVDIDIRDHNRKAIEDHPLYSRMTMIEGSSIDPEIIYQVKKESKQHQNILVFLDSNHTHNHVLAELEAYAPLTSKGSYCVVFDTVIDDLPDGLITDRPWGKGNNPKTAVREYLKTNDRFEIDKEMENKLLVTVAPDGFLKCVKA